MIIQMKETDYFNIINTILTTSTITIPYNSYSSSFKDTENVNKIHDYFE
jgi:hypothetical protein